MFEDDLNDISGIIAPNDISQVENSFIDLFKQKAHENHNNNLFGEDTIVTDQSIMDEKEQEEYH